jgi:RNA polymerase sigma-70 factor (ECF subfamily)
MSTEIRSSLDDPVVEGDLARARAGDAAAFDRLVRPLRVALHAHCYRMLGSAHDADDAVQDALLRAWRKLSGFESRSSFRNWLYAVATRCCLDALAQRKRRALPTDLGPSSDQVVLDDTPLTDVAWLGPYPDGRLGDPSALAEEREAVELAFVATLQHLPGNQRAALLLFDVVGFSAAEIAAIMDTSVAAINSAIQRARAMVADRVPSRSQQATIRDIGDIRLREIVDGYARALETGDVDTLVELLTSDVTWSMPPLPHWYSGIAAVTDFAVQVPFACGSWRHRATSANGQPAIGCYLWNQERGAHLAWSINVLTLQDERIAAITSFIGAEHFELLGLPTRLN